MRGRCACLCVVAIGLFATPGEAAAPTFGPATSVGTVRLTGGFAVTASELGRMALALGGNRKLFVATAGREGGFGKVRAVELSAPLPRFPTGGTIAYLGLDDSGRMVTLVDAHHGTSDDCCTVATAVFLDARARVRDRQALAPSTRSSLASMSWHRSGTSGITVHSGGKYKLAIGTPSTRFSLVDVPPARDARVFAGPGRFAAWLRTHDESNPAVVSRTVTGDWSPRRYVGPTPTGNSSLLERVAFGPDRLTLVAWTSQVDFVGTSVVQAAWLRGGRIVRRQTLADYPEGPNGDEMRPVVDGAGDGMVIWRDGDRTLRMAHAEPGGRFSAPRRLWRAAPGQAVDSLHTDSGPHGAIATWRTYPTEFDGPPGAVRAARVDASGLHGTAVLERETASLYSLGGGLVALDGRGRGAVVWTEGLGDGRVRIRSALVRR